MNAERKPFAAMAKRRGVVSAGIPSRIPELMAQRVRWLHHYTWHEVRNSWELCPERTRKTLAVMGWAPVRPARDSEGAPSWTKARARTSCSCSG